MNLTFKNITLSALVFFICLPFFSLAQTKDITYDQTQNVSFVAQYKNNTEIDSYLTKDGMLLKVGDTLTIGKAIIFGNAINNRKKYLYDDVFTYIVAGNVKGRSLQEFNFIPHDYTGDKVIIKSLFVSHEKYKGYKLFPKRKFLPLYVSIFVKSYKTGISKVFSHSRITILDIERAFVSGEVLNDNAPIPIPQRNLENTNDDIKYDLLIKLGKLKDSGVLSDEEFQKEKKKILDRK